MRHPSGTHLTCGTRTGASRPSWAAREAGARRDRQGFPELLRGRGERVDGRVLRTMVPVLVRACWAPASVRMMASRWLRMVGSGKAPSPVWGRGLGGRGGGVVVTLSWWRIRGYSAVTSATAARVAASSTMVLLVA